MVRAPGRDDGQISHVPLCIACLALGVRRRLPWALTHVSRYSSCTSCAHLGSEKKLN